MCSNFIVRFLTISLLTINKTNPTSKCIKVIYLRFSFCFCRALESPIMGLRDIHENKVLTVCFCDPKYPEDFIFKAKRLAKAIDPPTVLAPEHRASNYRPQIGFNRNFPQASLGDAGHRMVNHYSGGNNNAGGNASNNRNYASIGPPQNYRGEYLINITTLI